jgi:Fe-S-cluster containining protein
MTATPTRDPILFCPAQSYCCIRLQKNLPTSYAFGEVVTSSVKRRSTKRYPGFQNGPSLSAFRNDSITTSLHKWMQHCHSQPESDACPCGLRHTTRCGQSKWTSQSISTSRRLEQHSLCLTHEFLMVAHSTPNFVRSQVRIRALKRRLQGSSAPLSKCCEIPQKGRTNYLSYSSKFVTFMVMNYDSAQLPTATPAVTDTSVQDSRSSITLAVCPEQYSCPHSTTFKPSSSRNCFGSLPTIRRHSRPEPASRCVQNPSRRNFKTFWRWCNLTHATDFGHCPSSQALTTNKISEHGYGLLDPARETRSKDLSQYVLSLPFPLEAGDIHSQKCCALLNPRRCRCSIHQSRPSRYIRSFRMFWSVKDLCIPIPWGVSEMALNPCNRSCRPNSSSNSPSVRITSCFVAAHNPSTLGSSCPSSAGSLTCHSQSLSHHTQFISEIPSNQNESTYVTA